MTLHVFGIRLLVGFTVVVVMAAAQTVITTTSTPVATSSFQVYGTSTEVTSVVRALIGLLLTTETITSAAESSVSPSAPTTTISVAEALASLSTTGTITVASVNFLSTSSASATTTILPILTATSVIVFSSTPITVDASDQSTTTPAPITTTVEPTTAVVTPAQTTESISSIEKAVALATDGLSIASTAESTTTIQPFVTTAGQVTTAPITTVTPTTTVTPITTVTPTTTVTPDTTIAPTTEQDVTTAALSAESPITTTDPSTTAPVPLPTTTVSAAVTSVVGAVTSVAGETLPLSIQASTTAASGTVTHVASETTQASLQAPTPGVSGSTTNVAGDTTPVSPRASNTAGNSLPSANTVVTPASVSPSTVSMAAQSPSAVSASVAASINTIGSTESSPVKATASSISAATVSSLSAVAIASAVTNAQSAQSAIQSAAATSSSVAQPSSKPASAALTASSQSMTGTLAASGSIVTPPTASNSAQSAGNALLSSGSLFPTLASSTSISTLSGSQISNLVLNTNTNIVLTNSNHLSSSSVSTQSVPPNPSDGVSASSVPAAGGSSTTTIPVALGTSSPPLIPSLTGSVDSASTLGALSSNLAITSGVAIISLSSGSLVTKPGASTLTTLLSGLTSPTPGAPSEPPTPASSGATSTGPLDSMPSWSTSSPSLNITAPGVFQDLQACRDLWITLHNHTVVIEQSATGDPDIAGTGVLVAFLIPAYFTWVLALVAYLMDWINKREKSTLDKKFLKFLHIGNRNVSERTERAVRKTVLLCSDLQIVAGLGILIAAFSHWSTISVYHYQVAAYLAWMSSNVHITTMTILRGHLKENHRARYWRIGFMFILLIFLIVALVPTISKSWAWLNGSSGFSMFGVPKPHFAASVPSKCFWREEFTQDVDVATIFSYLILALMYIWKLCMLYESSASFLRKWLRAKPQYYLQQAVSRAGKGGKKLWYKTCLGLYMVFVALADFCESFLASLWTIGINLIWGTLRLVTPRLAVPRQVQLDEKKVTFGQVLPVFLLLLPLMMLAEKLFSKHKSSPFATPPTNHGRAFKLRQSPTPTPYHESSEPVLRAAEPTWRPRVPNVLMRRNRATYQNIASNDSNDTPTRPFLAPPTSAYHDGPTVYLDGTGTMQSASYSSRRIRGISRELEPPSFNSVEPVLPLRPSFKLNIDPTDANAPPDFGAHLPYRDSSPHPLRSRSHSAVSFFDDEPPIPAHPATLSRSQSIAAHPPTLTRSQSLANSFKNQCDTAFQDPSHDRAVSLASFYDAETLYEPSHISERDRRSDEKWGLNIKESAKRLFSVRRKRHFSEPSGSYTSLTLPYNEKVVEEVDQEVQTRQQQRSRRPSNMTTSSYRPLLLSPYDHQSPQVHQQQPHHEQYDPNTPFSTHILHLPPLPSFAAYFSNHQIDPSRTAFLYTSRLFTSIIVYLQIFLAVTFGTVVYVVGTAVNTPVVELGNISGGERGPGYNAQWNLVGYVVGGLATGMVVMMCVGMAASRLCRLDDQGDQEDRDEPS